MGMTEDLAQALAFDTIAAAEEMGDPNLIDDVSKVLGAASQTTQEAYMTAVRVILSEKRARKYLEDRIAKSRASGQAHEKIDLAGRKIMNTQDENFGGGGH